MRLYRLAIDGHLRPQLGPVPITDVSAADMLRVQHRLRATPYMANRVIAVASKLMNWTAQHGYRDPHTNPCEGIEKCPETARKRYLTLTELRRVGAALRVAERYDAISKPAIVAIRLLLFTGARVSEILGLKWTRGGRCSTAVPVPPVASALGCTDMSRKFGRCDACGQKGAVSDRAGAVPLHAMLSGRADARAHAHAGVGADPGAALSRCRESGARGARRVAPPV